MRDYQNNSDNTSSNNSVASSKAVLSPINIAKGVIVGGVNVANSKSNPLEKKINLNNANDTGNDTARLGYKTTKGTVKAVQKTIKTAERTVKTTKKAVKTTKEVTKTTYKTTKAVGKAVAKVVQVTVDVLSKVIAAVASNPLILLAVFIIIYFAIMCSAVAAIVGGGGAAGTASNKNALANMAIKDKYAIDAYNTAASYFNNAVAEKKSNFNKMIDSLVYDSNNLPTSDLVYMERTSPNPTVIYQTSFATLDQKNKLKDSWNNGIIPTKEAVAIAYVYLQKENNKSNNTENQIYIVEFPEKVFTDVIVEKVIQYSSPTQYSGQYCGGTCTRTVDYVPNEPYYSNAEKAVNSANNAYNEWNENVVKQYEWYKQIPVTSGQQAVMQQILKNVENWNSSYAESFGEGYIYVNDVLDGGEQHLSMLENTKNKCQETLNNTPQYIEVEYLSCSYQHNLYSIGLAFYTADDLMNALDFTDYEKKWYEYILMGYNALGIV